MGGSNDTARKLGRPPKERRQRVWGSIREGYIDRLRDLAEEADLEFGRYIGRVLQQHVDEMDAMRKMKKSTKE